MLDDELNDPLERLLQPDNLAENPDNQEQEQEEKSVSDIDLDPKVDTFEILKNEFTNQTQCIRETYRRWLNLCIEDGVNIFLNNKDIIEKEKIIETFKVNYIRNGKTQSGYICKYCNDHCSLNDIKDAKKKNKKCTKYSISELKKIRCVCSDHAIKEEIQEGDEEYLGIFRKKSIHSSAAQKIIEKIMDDLEQVEGNERRDFLRKKFTDFSNDPEKEKIILDVYYGFFFDYVIEFFNRYKGSEISSILKYAEEIFNDFSLYKIKINDNDEDDKKKQLKQKAVLTYSFITLIVHNSSIFSIKRGIEYEMVPHDLSLITYAYKRKIISENLKLNELYKKCDLTNYDIFENFFDEESRLFENETKNNGKLFYSPISFLVENCFIENELFRRKNDEQRYHFLRLDNTEHSENIYTYINTNNIIQIFDDFLLNGKTERDFYTYKKDALTKDLFERQLKNSVDQEEFETRNQMGVFFIDFLNFESRFLDIDKEKMLRVLSLYTNKLSEDFKNVKSIEEIFDLIKGKLNNIVKNSKNKNDSSSKDLAMIGRTLNLFGVPYNSDNIENYDFSELIREIINCMVIEKLAIRMKGLGKKDDSIANEIMTYDEFSPNFILNKGENKISDMFDYIIKILVLFCTNNEGKDYIYNSSFMKELIDILTEDIKYEEPSDKEREFLLDVLPILKFNFNQKILANAFIEKIGTSSNNVLLNSFFRDDPSRFNESIYDFSQYLNVLERIKGYYDLFKGVEGEINFKKMEMILDKLDNKNISISKGLRYIFLDSINEKFDCIYDPQKNDRTEISKIRYYTFNLINNLKFLSNTGLLLKNGQNMPLLENKDYDISAFLKSEKIPLFFKSLLLDFLLHYTMAFKVDEKLNCVEIFPYSKVTKIDENQSSHFDNIILLINIYSFSIELIKDSTEEELKEAFIERNGLYDFCLSIVKGINCFNNFSNNIIARHENEFDKMFCDYYNRLIAKFLKYYKQISLCLFNKLILSKEDNEKRKSLKKELKSICGLIEYKDTIEWYKNIYIKFKPIFENYLPILNDPSIPYLTSIYNRFTDYNEGKLFSPSSDDAYSYLFHYNFPQFDQNEIDKYKLSQEILNNYKGFCHFLEKERIKNGIDIVLSTFETKIGNYTVREYFFVKYFIKILLDNFDEFFNDAIILNAFTKLIIYDKKLINFDGIDKKDEILEKYQIEYNEEEINTKLKTKIIGTLIRKINYVVNYEISESICFSNTKHEIQLSEYANALIIFTQVLGENFNCSFHQAMFEYTFNLQDEIKGKKNGQERNKEEDKSLPIAKYDVESESFKPIGEETNIDDEIEKKSSKRSRRNSSLKKMPLISEDGDIRVAGIEINKGCVPYLLLLILYQKILDLLYSKDKEFIIQDNLIMIFHSLTNCLEEFSHVKNDIHKQILNNFLTDMFLNESNPITNKIKSLLIYYNDLRCNTKDSKLDFIINDLLVILNVFLNNDDKNLIGFNSDPGFKECYWELLTVEYFVQSLATLNPDYNDITNEELFELYNDKKLDSIPTFHLVLKYYEILYFLSKKINLHLFDFIFASEISEKKIMKYLAKCKEQNVIVNIIGSDEKKIRKTIYKFLNDIFIDLDIYFEENDRVETTTTILQSEINYLSEESKNNYLDNVDRTSTDTKLLSIYDNVDSMLYEMIYNANKKPSRWEIKDYTTFDYINFSFILLYNIILIYLYYKSTTLPLDIYNQFDPEKYHLQNNYLIPFLTICHFGLLFYIFISWYKNKFSVKYFYDLSQYCKVNVNEKDKLSIEKKSVLFKELTADFSRDIKTIWKFFPGLSDQQKIYIAIMDSILFNDQILSFLISFICIILYYISSQIYLILPILLFAKFVPTLSAIFSGLAGKFKYLITVYIYTFTALYVFSWAGFIFLPRMFNKEVVFEVEDPARVGVEEAMCSSSVQCILYFLNFGLTEGNAGMEVLSYKDNMTYYFYQFIFDLCYNLLVNMIFANVFTGLITDAFGENREKAWTNEIDKEEVCFICQITKSECINKHIDFKDHRLGHSVWKYIYYLCGIVLKGQTEFNFEENYVWKKFKETSIDWYPIKKDEDDVKEAIKANGEKIDQVLESLEEIKKK